MISRLRAMVPTGLAFIVNQLLRVPSHPFRRWVVRALAEWRLGEGVTVMRSCRIIARGGVVIGDRTIIGDRCVIDGRGGLTIGSDVNISGGTTILTAGHSVKSPTFAGTKRAVVISNRAWIATGCLLLPGVTVGEGAVAGAGSVIRGDVPAWEVWAGNPATKQGDRPDSAQARLEPFRAPFF